MNGPIAIVGISTELPGGISCERNLDHTSFYNFLLNKGEAYGPIPSERFNISSWSGQGLAEIHVDRGAFLKGIDEFDNVEFGVSARDARYMAPATRKIIENCFLALLDAGIDYRGKRIGCFTSAITFDLQSVTEPDEYEARGSFAGFPAQVANRVSNHLDLLGPSLPTDTACSSTFTAFHLAVQAIKSGDCDGAVVAGCQLNHRFMDWIIYSQGSLLAKDGKCKPFDADADGFARAEACAAVVLKPLDAALRDNDRIYATVLGTAINSSGGGAPPGAPVADAQRDAMQEAFLRAGRRPQDVDFVELHATGTAKGDPTEANWVGECFHREDELLLGSVKGNIGHTEIVAFLSSLSKVLSIFEHKVIPPTVNLNRPNPAIKWKEYNLRVPTDATDLPHRHGEKSLIAMSSSGIGGSNGHVVLESAPLQTYDAPLSTSEPRAILVMACGLSPRSAELYGKALSEKLVHPDASLPTLATILGRRAKQMTWRSFAVYSQRSGSLEFSAPKVCPRKPRRVVMVFSGQGPQHKDMGRQLFADFPVFRQSILELDEVVQKMTGQSFLKHYGLFNGTPSAEVASKTWPIRLTLPAIAMFQMALFDLMTSIGIHPEIIIGHSAGETAMLYASGAAPKAMAMELAIIRGSCFSQLEEVPGGMAALACSPERAEKIIQEDRVLHPTSGVEIGCYNSPSAVAIAGPNQDVERVVALASSFNIFARKLQTKVPFHSSMMELVKDEYLRELQALFARYPGHCSPTVTVQSTLTGEPFSGAFDANYFWANTRSQVQFAQAITKLPESDAYTFIELAPHPVLSSYVSSMIDNATPVLYSTRRAKEGASSAEHVDFLTVCGSLTAAGYNGIDFTLLNRAPCYATLVDLPPYPFNRRTFPLYPDTPATAKQLTPRKGPLNHSYLKVNKDTHPTLGEHIIRGEPIMPAAGFLEMAIEQGAPVLMDVNFRSMLSLSPENPARLTINVDGSRWKVYSGGTAYNAQGDSDGVRRQLHADGYLSFERPEKVSALDIAAIRSRCISTAGSDFYQQLSYFSTYGPRLRRVSHLCYSIDEALMSIRGLDEELALEGNYIMHPAVLDACFHATAYKPFHGDFDPKVYYLPARVNALIVHTEMRHKDLPSRLYAYIKFREWGPDTMTYDIILTDAKGAPLCSLDGFQVQKHRFQPLPTLERPFDVILQPAELDLEKSVPIPTLTLLNDVALEVVPLITNILEQILKGFGASRRLLRILFVSDSEALLANLASLLTEYHNFYAELCVSEQHIQDVPDMNPCAGLIRTVPLTVRSISSRRQSPESFDLAVVFGTITESVDLLPTLELCYQMLSTGGSLIVATPSELETVLVNTVASLHPPLASMHQANGALDLPRGVICHVAPLIHSGGKPYSVGLVSKSGIAEDLRQETMQPADRVIVSYVLGEELKIQERFDQLDVSSELSIWIVAQGGPNGGAAQGFARALRREYLSWKIHLVIAPYNLRSQTPEDILRLLPASLKHEPEIHMSSSGRFQIPYMLPLPPPDVASKDFLRSADVPDSEAVLQVSLVASHHVGDVLSFFGHVNDSRQAHCSGFVAGLAEKTAANHIEIDPLTVCPVPDFVVEQDGRVLAALPGLVTAVLAVGQSSWSRSEQLQSLSILVTHADGTIGQHASGLYDKKHLSCTTVPSNATLLCLMNLGYQRFDLIISGYSDKAHLQVLERVLRQKGRIFSWNDPEAGILGVLNKDPCRFSDALAMAVRFIAADLSHSEAPTSISTSHPSPPICGAATPRSQRTLFDAENVYLLLGGVGSLGAQIALLLYQRGARHIILTSRRGEDSLKTTKNVIMQRMFSYLRSRKDLDIRLEAVDATCESSMRALLKSIEPRRVAGCMVLTAALADGVFRQQTAADFARIFASKTGVLKTVLTSAEVSNMDFLVAFSSVSALFGIAGQTNYDGANTALEKLVEDVHNGYSFVCPGILDSTVMLSGGLSTEEVRLEHFIDWSLSAEEMLLWLEDSLVRFLNGQRFKRYIPDHDWELMDRTLGMTDIGRHLVPNWTHESVPEENRAEVITQLCRTVLGIPQDEYSSELPLTSFGLDSLSASRLSFALRALVEVSQIQLLANISVKDLQQMADAAASSASTDGPSGTTGFVADKVKAMREMLAKYSDGMSPISRPASILLPSKRIVLLTGTSGSFGCSILARLIGDEDVRMVYALNRSGGSGVSAVARQEAALVANGHPAELATSKKLILLEGDLSLPGLGIPQAVVQQIKISLTHIIHNAWMIDLGKPLEEFEGLIAGTRHLINLAAQCAPENNTAVMLVSSIGVYQNNLTAPAPEAPIDDPATAVQTGYMESKWVAEQLLHAAASKMHLRAQVARVGLLTGGPNGFWNTSHWLPAIVQSGPIIGCLPDGGDDVSWISMEAAAAAVVDAMTSTEVTLHIVHPHPTKWHTVMSMLAARLQVSLVPFSEWFDRLENTAMDTETGWGGGVGKSNGHVQDLVASKLLDAYRLGLQTMAQRPFTESMGLLPQVECAKAVQASKTLRSLDLPQLGQGDVERWVRYWKNIGYLQTEAHTQ